MDSVEISIECICSRKYEKEMKWTLAYGKLKKVVFREVNIIELAQIS